MRSPTTPLDQLVETLTEIARALLSDPLWAEIITAEDKLKQLARSQDALHILRQQFAEDKLKQLARSQDALHTLRQQLTSLKPRKRGRRPKPIVRDLQIATAIFVIVAIGKFKATRSHTRSALSPSACSIVQAALARLGDHRSERAIESIWGRHRADVCTVRNNSLIYSGSNPTFVQEFICGHVVVRNKSLNYNGPLGPSFDVRRCPKLFGVTAICQTTNRTTRSSLSQSRCARPRSPRTRDDRRSMSAWRAANMKP
jgi:hypothetical protein